MADSRNNCFQTFAPWSVQLCLLFYRITGNSGGHRCLVLSARLELE